MKKESTKHGIAIQWLKQYLQIQEKIMLVISKQPKCEICNKQMKDWNPFADKHYHNECLSDQLTTKFIIKIKEQLEQKRIQ